MFTLLVADPFGRNSNLRQIALKCAIERGNIYLIINIMAAYLN